MSQALLAAGLAVWALGAAVDLLAGAGRKAGRLAPYASGVVGGAAVCVSGVLAVTGAPRTVGLGTTLGVGETVVRIDALAGMFLTLTGALAVLVSASLVGWSAPEGRVRGRGTGAGYLLLLGSVVVVVVAGDAFTFLFAWESLTVALYVLTGVRRSGPGAGRPAWLTLAIGKVGGAALLVGFLLLAAQSKTFVFTGWAAVPAGGVRNAAFALLVAGFAAKVGIVPLQGWVPAGYPVAPGPTRAALAGVAVNAGFYGLWRVLGILGRPPVALAVVVLVAGGVTALVGIAFAAVQSNLSRVVAYSSVENAGIIVVGYGVALAGAAGGQGRLVALGLLAASLQVLAHAVAKTGLFASSAFFESDRGTDDLESLRGVGRTHRWSAVTFGVGSLTLAGLPPTIGFVSEWFILEALLQQFRLPGLEIRLAMAVAGALVALTAGVAALTFVRLLGLTVLGGGHGQPRPAAARPGPADVCARGGLAVLAVGCLGLAAVAPWVVRFVARGLAPIVAERTVAGALKSPWVLQPVYPDFSILSPSWLFVTMPIGFVAVGLAALALSRGGLFRVRRVPAWRSASAGVAGPDRYSSWGYASPARHVLGNILGTRRTVAAVDGSAGAAGTDGEPSGTAGGPHIEVRAEVVEPVETYLYEPLRRLVVGLAVAARRLQSGRLEAYVSYMLVALLALLALVAALH